MKGGQTARGAKVFFRMNRAGIQLGLDLFPRALIPCGKIFCRIYFFCLGYI